MVRNLRNVNKILDPGLSDAQVFSIAFAFASFVLLARIHCVSVNVAPPYRVCVSRISRISHFPRMVYGVSYIAYHKRYPRSFSFVSLVLTAVDMIRPEMVKKTMKNEKKAKRPGRLIW